MKNITYVTLGLLLLSVFAVYSAAPVSAWTTDSRSCNIAGAGTTITEVCAYFNTGSSTTSRGKSGTRPSIDGDGETSCDSVSILANTAAFASGGEDAESECADLLNRMDGCSQDLAIVDYRADPNNYSSYCVDEGILEWSDVVSAQSLHDHEVDDSAGFFGLRSEGDAGWIDGLFFASTVSETPTHNQNYYTYDHGLVVGRVYEYTLDKSDGDGDDDSVQDVDELDGVRLGFKDANGVYTTSRADLQDTDSDGLDDGDEITAGTNNHDTDTDDDGYGDAADVANCDGTDPDPDGDNVNDYAESIAGTDCLVADTDGDSVDDGTELQVMGTNPLLRDTDGDGCTDGVEGFYSTDPLDDGSVDTGCTIDPDNDGCNNGDEIYLFYTNPNVARSVDPDC